MEYRIKPSKKKDYIVLIVTGEFNGQEMMQVIMEAHTMGNKMGINNFLVDVRKARNVDSILGNYEFAHTKIQNTEGLNPGAHVAALVSPGDRSHDFIETVLINAGKPIKLFSDFDEAVKYLFKK